jgi:opacity protein-like surface antigen
MTDSISNQRAGDGLHQSTKKENRMRMVRNGLFWIAFSAASFLIAAPASGQGEATFVLGGLIGGDLLEVIEGDLSLTTAFENGAIYGGRLGWYGFPLGVEGSFVYSNSGISATIEDFITLDARVIYAEANVLLIILPGPIQPFVTGGAGLHSFKLNDVEGAEANKFGYNFGFGVKAAISRLALRFDVRDHRTPFDAGDFGVEEDVARALGFEGATLDNVEISFGVGIRF